MKTLLSYISLFLFFSCCSIKEVRPVSESPASSHFNTISERFLQNIKEGKDTKEIREQLANSSLEEVQNALRTDAQRYAFWMNIYNAYIIFILSEHPELYENKEDFFTRDQIPLAGEIISFDLIEHGILRKSQWKLGLGYLRKWFPKGFERKLRVEKRDYRIHFALNCGAKDCPPVAIYTPKRVHEQLDKGSKNYLHKTTKSNLNSKEVQVTPLFSWFRGDFGGKKGIKEILERHGLIKNPGNIDLSFKGYDWTLDIDHYIDL